MRRRLGPVVLAGLAVVFTAVAASAQGPVSVVPILDGGATDAFVWTDLANGRTVLVERLQREPRQARLTALEPGLFTAVGRPTDQPARPGEAYLAPILDGGKVRHGFFAEGSTGYVAYFEELGRRGSLGTVRTALGRPFGPLAGNGGAYLLLPRLERGRTSGFYMMDTVRGRGLYLSGVRELAMEPELVATSAAPVLPGVPAAAALDFEGTTTGYLLLDGSGAFHHVFLDRERPESLDVRPVGLQLGSVLPEAERETLGRYHLLPLHDGRGTTVQVLLVDAASGGTALIYDPAGTSPPPRLFPLGIDIDASLPAEGARSLGLVPRQEGSGATVGAWIVDGPSQTVLYLDAPGSPPDATLSRVALER